MARQYYKDTTTGQMKPLGVKVEDTLPVGTIVEYTGSTIPEGWVDIGSGKIEKQYQVIPTNALLENGDSTSATNGYTANYINNHSVIVSPTEPSTDRKKVWLQHNGNIFDGEIELGSYDNSTGAKDTLQGFYRNKNIIPVKQNQTYTLSIDNSKHRMVLYYYTSNGTFISYEGVTTGTFTTPNNCENINFRCYEADYVSNYSSLNIRIEEGTEIISDKEYILNNDVYEEFINNQPVVLYNNPTGTTGNITLSDSVANYNYIEIYFMDNSGYSRFEKYYNVNGKTVDLGILKLNNITNKQLKLTSKNVTISGTSITNGDAIVSYIKLDANVTGDSYATNELSITRVLGYN